MFGVATVFQENVDKACAEIRQWAPIRWQINLRIHYIAKIICISQLEDTGHLHNMEEDRFIRVFSEKWL